MTDQKYQLAIEDTVDVPLKFTLKAGRVNRVFAFSLYCKRLSQEQFNALLEESGKKVTDVMREVITGWDDHQRLVLDAAGNPAPFSEEARDVMLSAAAFGTLAYNKYLVEVGAKEKN